MVLLETICTIWNMGECPFFEKQDSKCRWQEFQSQEYRCRNGKAIRKAIIDLLLLDNGDPEDIVKLLEKFTYTKI